MMVEHYSRQQYTLSLGASSLAWALAAPSDKASETFCRNAAVNFMARRDFALLLVLRETGEIVGSSGLHRPDWTVPKMEVG
jgi:hypothetical protein